MKLRDDATTAGYTGAPLSAWSGPPEVRTRARRGRACVRECVCVSVCECPPGVRGHRRLACCGERCDWTTVVTGFLLPTILCAQEAMAVVVDEASCIGCVACAALAPNTFAIETRLGRARVLDQWADDADAVLDAVDACPVTCIHRVPREQCAAASSSPFSSRCLSSIPLFFRFFSRPSRSSTHHFLPAASPEMSARASFSVSSTCSMSGEADDGHQSASRAELQGG
jgi:ferredoxin